MRIAVDAFPLAVKTFSGIPNYVRNVFTRLLRIDSANEYFPYCKIFFEPIHAENLTMRLGCGTTKNSSSFGNTLWLFTKGVQMMRNDKIDIFWGTRHLLPPGFPRRIKKVLTVHDLVWHIRPATMSGYNRITMKLLADRSIKAADHIIAVSQSTASSVMEIFKVPAEKISVIYHGADQYTALNKDESAEYISDKYGTDRNYILTVGTVEPRKNLSTLLRTFNKLRDEGFQLLIAGADGWKTSPVYREYEKSGFTDREVRFLGYVPDSDMNRLYSGAGLFVFPSIYEGFGIPPLEAMASGTPVIVSDSSSLPEVAGDAGILISPYDVEGWRAAILRVMSDKALQNEMIIHGLKQSIKFSWDESARQTLKVFEKFV